MIRVRRILLPHAVAHLFRLHCSEDLYLKCGGLSDIVWLSWFTATRRYVKKIIIQKSDKCQQNVRLNEFLKTLKV